MLTNCTKFGNIVIKYLWKDNRTIGKINTILLQPLPNSSSFIIKYFNRASEFLLPHHIINPKINMSTEKPKIVFVLGGPGAGKGTQCQKIVDKFDFVHLSAGDLLREERHRKGSQFGELIETYITDGKIVPVEVTCSLLENAIEKHMTDCGKMRFLIDGFPRNQDNLDGWNKQMSTKVDFLFVLFFDCDGSICFERCLNRGKCGSGRSDDNEASLKKRIETYNNDSLPIIQYYKNLNKVRQIDASPNADDVFEQVVVAFKECTGMASGDK